LMPEVGLSDANGVVKKNYPLELDFKQRKRLLQKSK